MYMWYIWCLCASRLYRRWDNFPDCFSFFISPAKNLPCVCFYLCRQGNHNIANPLGSHPSRGRSEIMIIMISFWLGVSFQPEIKRVGRLIPLPNMLQTGGTSHSWDEYQESNLPELSFTMLLQIFFNVVGLYVESK